MIYGDIRALAVPFVLMVAKKGLDAWKAKDSKAKETKKPAKKTVKKPVKKSKISKQLGGALDALNQIQSYINTL